MRRLNIVLFVATVALLWLAARLALRNDVLALAAASPFVLSELSLHNAMQISADAFLPVTLALMLYVWMWLHLAGKGRSWSGAVLLGALAGLVTSAKWNGALLVIAAAGYLVVSRARWRWPKALVACVVSVAAFAAVNPVFLTNPAQVVSDVLARRLAVINLHNQTAGPMPYLELLQQSFPAWPLVCVIGMVLWRCRRQPWFAPLAWWGLTLALGTWFTIDQPYARYRAPIELGLYIPLGTCLASILSAPRRRL